MIHFTQKELVNDLIQLNCDMDLIQAICDALQAKHYDEAQYLLIHHKCRLLEHLHRSQANVDLIDFLLYKLKKERKAVEYET